MLKKSLAVILSVLILSAVAGCNTTRGVGQDVEAGGEAIQRSTQ
ncbi:entericidin A/B family lipoprotein [Brenneria rubrifaciens]|uniref:Entericidin A/B family lipoprotein n=1 Tax=Brenneria rubrifaciens TaxID=55213 RepID=A0A4V1FA38_9GAMM|nr:entericidin A/B family lipoprotein [Brenneria rubrifaciens]QCR09723.1 entericidin A/B family lipoprotein [Brenneria rubrifaciens]